MHPFHPHEPAPGRLQSSPRLRWLGADPVGYSGTPEGKQQAENAGRVAGDYACGPLCGEIGAVLGGAFYDAWSTDPSKGTLVPLAIQGWARDRARRYQLARALDQVLLKLEALGVKRTAALAALMQHGLPLVPMYPKNELPPGTDSYAQGMGGGWVMKDPGVSDGVYFTPIPYYWAPPSYFKAGPYPGDSVANEGDVELHQWADHLDDLNKSGVLTNLVKPELLPLPPFREITPSASSSKKSSVVPVAIGAAVVGGVLWLVFG